MAPKILEKLNNAFNGSPENLFNIIQILGTAFPNVQDSLYTFFMMKYSEASAIEHQSASEIFRNLIQDAADVLSEKFFCSMFFNSSKDEPQADSHFFVIPRHVKHDTTTTITQIVLFEPNEKESYILLHPTLDGKNSFIVCLTLMKNITYLDPPIYDVGTKGNINVAEFVAAARENFDIHDDESHKRFVQTLTNHLDKIPKVSHALLGNNAASPENNGGLSNIPLAVATQDFSLAVDSDFFPSVSNTPVLDERGEVATPVFHDVQSTIINEQSASAFNTTVIHSPAADQGLVIFTASRPSPAKELISPKVKKADDKGKKTLKESAAKPKTTTSSTEQRTHSTENSPQEKPVPGCSKESSLNIAREKVVDSPRSCCSDSNDYWVGPEHFSCSYEAPELRREVEKLNAYIVPSPKSTTDAEMDDSVLFSAKKLDILLTQREENLAKIIDSQKSNLENSAFNQMKSDFLSFLEERNIMVKLYAIGKKAALRMLMNAQLREKQLNLLQKMVTDYQQQIADMSETMQMNFELVEKCSNRLTSSVKSAAGAYHEIFVAYKNSVSNPDVFCPYCLATKSLPEPRLGAPIDPEKLASSVRNELVGNKIIDPPKSGPQLIEAEAITKRKRTRPSLPSNQRGKKPASARLSKKLKIKN